MKKIVVPEGMLKAAWDKQLGTDPPTFSWDETNEVNRTAYRRMLGAALLWLSENPIVPTDEQWQSMRDWDSRESGFDTFFRHVLAEWQRRMFLAPEPEIPEEIEDLTWNDHPDSRQSLSNRFLNEQLIEAYRRGKNSK